MPARSFQRAREPAQKAQRTRALVAAATRLLARHGVAAVTLSEIARTAGVVKSNVYRYFESREHILLEILLSEQTVWLDELERALAPIAGRADVDGVARAIAATIARRPVACELMSVMANVLEHNLSADAVLDVKLRTLALSERAGAALRAALPALTDDDVAALLRYLHALVAGLWPMAHPAPVMAEVLTRTEMCGLVCAFEPDLRGAVGALLRGLCAARAAR